MRKKQFIVLILALISLSCSGLVLGQPTRIAYLMPEGFTGGVIVLYGQRDGVKPEIANDGTVLYRIPKDGFLKVNTDFDTERDYKFHFYYIDGDDNPTPIEYILPGGPNLETMRNINMLSEEEKNTKVFAMNHRTVGFHDKNQKSQPLYAFSVGYPKNADLIYGSIDRRIGKIEEELLRKP